VKHTLSHAAGSGIGPSIGLVVVAATLASPAAGQSTIAAQEAQLTAGPHLGTDDYFGLAVALEGGLAAAGAYGDNDGSRDLGSAYVFERSATTWALQAKLAASDRASDDYFGRSVGVSGTTILVGAYGDNHSSLTDAGSAYLFDRCGGAWTEVAHLFASDAAGGDIFGEHVAVDGDWAVVGARRHEHAGGFSDAGAAYVFRRVDGGTPSDPCDDTWLEYAELDASDASAGDEFGISVDVDGGRIVVGAWYDDSPAADAGSAYLFELQGGVWVETTRFFAPVPAAGDQFGRAVAIDGDTVVVTSDLDDHLGLTNAGSAYVFALDPSFGVWAFQDQLVASDASAGAGLGDEGVDVEAGRVALGARYADLAGASSGAIYVFERSGTTWSEVVRYAGSDSVAADELGFGVALSGDAVLSGTWGHDDTVSNQGAAYVHRLSRGRFAELGPGDGSCTPCPCANESRPGMGQGCGNSTGFGARLAAWGTDDLSRDDLRFFANNLKPGGPGLLFAGASALAGGCGVPFGDGLRVAGGFVVRLGVQAPDPGGNAVWGPGLAAGRGWSPGYTRVFQVWYRDPLGSPCGSGYNLSNALAVTFAP